MVLVAGLLDSPQYFALPIFFIVGNALGIPKVVGKQTGIGIAHRGQDRHRQQLRRKRHEAPFAALQVIRFQGRQGIEQRFA
ncbi:MAG TPA: hypothetical protein DCZ48_08470 [Methylococcaceae bacterium]|nr:hypothetical protein [Methylococcaceae bacterium]